MRIMYPDFEEVDYEVFAGLVVMELALNHIPLLFEDAPELVVYQQAEHIFEHRLIITHIIPGSLAQQARFLTIGDEFVMLNGKRVTTLKQLRNALSLSISTGFVTFSTKRAAMSVFSLKEVLQDEVRLSVDYAYPISPLMRRLIKKLKIIVEK
jgi:membrane-associated protease RseP (regulator of RpoE activity)